MHLPPKTFASRLVISAPVAEICTAETSSSVTGPIPGSPRSRCLPSATVAPPTGGTTSIKSDSRVPFSFAPSAVSTAPASRSPNSIVNCAGQVFAELAAESARSSPPQAQRRRALDWPIGEVHRIPAQSAQDQVQRGVGNLDMVRQVIGLQHCAMSRSRSAYRPLEVLSVSRPPRYLLPPGCDGDCMSVASTQPGDAGLSGISSGGIHGPGPTGQPQSALRPAPARPYLESRRRVQVLWLAHSSCPRTPTW